MPFDEAFRDWIIDFGDSGYVVRYRITNDGVMILAVASPEGSRVLRALPSGLRRFSFPKPRQQ
ncbi:MAG: hypothetical protein Q8M11_13605 [Sulfuritalea sp.]|nr:hypothetical protein [Sulfuritalea sp.]MDP1985460.1 hypothetical protein [Sulfuritalea sp.]